MIQLQEKNKKSLEASAADSQISYFIRLLLAVVTVVYNPEIKSGLFVCLFIVRRNDIITDIVIVNETVMGYIIKKKTISLSWKNKHQVTY